MKDSFTEAGMKDVCDRETGIVKRRLVCMERNTPRVLDDDGLWNCIGDPTKLALIFAQLLFRLLEILDVSACPVPSDDIACLVAEGLSAKQEPAVFSVVAPHTPFDFARLSRSQELGPLF